MGMLFWLLQRHVTTFHIARSDRFVEKEIFSECALVDQVFDVMYSYQSLTIHMFAGSSLLMYT